MKQQNQGTNATRPARYAHVMLFVSMSVLLTAATANAQSWQWLGSSSSASASIDSSSLTEGTYVTAGCPYTGEWSFQHYIDYTNFSGQETIVYIDYYDGDNGYPVKSGDTKFGWFDDSGVVLNGTKLYTANSGSSPGGFDLDVDWEQWPDYLVSTTALMEFFPDNTTIGSKSGNSIYPVMSE